MKILPIKIRDIINEKLNSSIVYEIRMKAQKNVVIYSNKGEEVLNYITGIDDINLCISRISDFSLYAYESDIRQGFITIKGGCRVGIAGECVIDKDSIKTIRNISSLNIRISREVVGCSDYLMRFLCDGQRVYNTIIISPPKCGKTTMIRDIARNISDGMDNIFLKGKKVSIIDERSEIAACYLGVPQCNVGLRTDVLDNCLKKQGLLMAVRSLSPDVIICDEIGTKDDVDALYTAFNSGVKIITTLHGYSIDDLIKRNVFKKLLEENVIERVVILNSKENSFNISNIYKLEGEKYICLK
ncbi:stage III sporulation protein AA [Clostridium sp. BJN0001]|uniref:stage III sporulation protein AA n=1 Tax=Clostridium sp. BJN0001 TaxID=2930219 RepID=UPI001FD00131|nr:stage III sporulation protein AA [Clostridium sp. BJN0001]